MSDDDKNGFVAGIYRNLEKLVPILGRIADALDADKKQEAKPEPREQLLPGLPDDDWTPPPVNVKPEVKPRKWGNSVRVYEYIAGFATPFTLEDMVLNSKDIATATGGKVGAASYSKILSVLVRAGAIKKVGRRTYRANKPTDELREAVEQMAKKRASAKECAQ